MCRIRFLTAGCSGFTEGIVISSGVAAGCAQGNHAARLALHDILQKSNELHPSTTTAQWVDDLTQRTQAPPSEVVNKAVEAALQLVQDLQGNKLAVASKSVVIATTSLIAKQVVSSLARHDIHIQEASQAMDLGLDVSSARKPMRRTMAKRWAKAGKRTRRCAQKAYGNGGCAAIVGQASEDGSGGSCIMRRSKQVFNMTIAILHPHADPAVQIPCNLIMQWLIIWEHNHRIRPKIGKVWAKIATAMTARSPTTRWIRTGTHVSCYCNTRATQLASQPTTPYLGKTLKATDGLSRQEVWELTTGGFGQAFRASIEGQLWEKAARRELGAGMEGGADFTTLFKHDKFLEKQGLHAARGICSWLRQRRRVGHTSEDIVQGWWSRRFARDARRRTRTCITEFGNVQPTQVRSLTRHSISFAQINKPKILWNVSGSGGSCHDPGTLQDTRLGFWRQFGSGVLTEASTCIFGDGSGTLSDPRTRRVGWSAVIFQGVSNCLGQTLECWKLHTERLANSLKPTGRWMGTLGEGEPNTVGRAELVACVVAAESTQSNVWSTSQTTRSSRKGRTGVGSTPRLGQGSNPNLWCRLSRVLKTRQGTFTVRWQRAHVAAADIKSENHDMALVLGNEMADAVAKQAASEAALRGAAAEQVSWVDALAWQVQRRIIESNLQASKANPTVLILRQEGLRKVQYKTVLQPHVEQTTHQLWECQICKQSMGETSVFLYLCCPLPIRPCEHEDCFEHTGWGSGPSSRALTSSSDHTRQREGNRETTHNTLHTPHTPHLPTHPPPPPTPTHPPPHHLHPHPHHHRWSGVLGSF